MATKAEKRPVVETHANERARPLIDGEIVELLPDDTVSFVTSAGRRLACACAMGVDLGWLRAALRLGRVRAEGSIPARGAGGGVIWCVVPTTEQRRAVPDVPGEEVRLTNLTQTGYDRFVLPDATVPITFVTDKAVIHTRSAVDTVISDAERRRLSVISRAQHLPEPSLPALRNVIVGEPSRGLRRAISTGKQYIGRAPTALLTG